MLVEMWAEGLSVACIDAKDLIMNVHKPWCIDQ